MHNADIVLDVAAGILLGGFALAFLVGGIMQATEARKNRQLFGPAFWRVAITFVVFYGFVIWRLLSN